MGRNIKTRLTLALITFIIACFTQVAMAREDTLWANDSWTFYTQPSFGSATETALSISNDAVSVHDGKEFRFYEGAGTGYIAMVAPSLSNATRVYTWAGPVPAVGQVLKVDSVSGGAVNLGFGSSGATPIFNATTVTSNYEVGGTIDVVYVNATPSDVTVTLVSATTSGCNGKMVNVQLVSSSGTRVIVDAPQTISGTSTVSAGLPGDSYTFRCDGSVWHLENYSEVIKRQMSCHLFNPAVGAPTADNDSGICSKWIQNVSANATVGDIEVRIMPGACSKPPACVAGVIDQSNYEWYVRHTASTLSKDLVVPHTFNPGVGNVDADMTLKCECLK